MAPKRAKATLEPFSDTSKDIVIFTKPEHQEIYKRLLSFTMPFTPYFEESMLKRLGFNEDIEWMAANIGWSQFLTMKELTYESLTLEFLTTLEVVGELLTFRLGNQDRELTLAQFNSIFGFSSGGLKSENERHDVDLSLFWEEIADCPNQTRFCSGRSRAIDIYNPCFRLMHRFVAQTVFGRDGETVFYGELLFLYAMTHELKLDTGAFIVNNMKNLRNINGKGSKADSVYAGGMITSVARYFSIDLDSLEFVGAHLIDTEWCVLLHIIFERNGRVYLRLPISTRPWYLPDVSHTTVKKRANWKSTFEDFDFENHNFEDEFIAKGKAETKAFEERLEKWRIAYMKTGPVDDHVTHNDEVEKDNGDCNGSDADPERDDPTVGSIVDRLESVEHKLERLNKIEDMMQHVYDWHVRQGHFQPLQ